MNYLSALFTQERLNNVSKAIVETTYEYPLPILGATATALVFGVQNIKAARGIVSVGIGAFLILAASIPTSRMIVNFQIFKDLVIADCQLLHAHLTGSDKKTIDTLKFQKIQLKRTATTRDFKERVDDKVIKAAAKFKANKRRRNSH